MGRRYRSHFAVCQLMVMRDSSIYPDSPLWLTHYSDASVARHVISGQGYSIFRMVSIYNYGRAPVQWHLQTTWPTEFEKRCCHRDRFSQSSKVYLHRVISPYISASSTRPLTRVLEWLLFNSFAKKANWTLFQELVWISCKNFLQLGDMISFLHCHYDMWSASSAS